MIPHISRPPLAFVIVAQILLGAIFLVGLATILLLIPVSTRMGENLPEFNSLVVPLLSICVGFIVAALIAVGMVSLLVTRIYRGTILDYSSLLRVDIIITAFACGAVLVVIGFFVVSDAQAGFPLLALAMLAACLVLLALASITVVLRSLLRHAIVMRTELDEVV